MRRWQLSTSKLAAAARAARVPLVGASGVRRKRPETEPCGGARTDPDHARRQPAAAAELVRLYVRRAQGEAVDPAELAAAGKQALRWVVPKQIDAGIDVGNNGEQQREGFFLYVQHRMSGFGGAWQRRPRGDVDRYPVFKAHAASSRSPAGPRSATSGRRRRSARSAISTRPPSTPSATISAPCSTRPTASSSRS